MECQIEPGRKTPDAWGTDVRESSPDTRLSIGSFHLPTALAPLVIDTALTSSDSDAEKRSAPGKDGWRVELVLSSEGCRISMPELGENACGFVSWRGIVGEERKCLDELIRRQVWEGFCVRP